MYKCPHCGERSITFFRKLRVTPRHPITCKACGGKVGVPGWSLWLMAPFVVAGFLLPQFIEPVWACVILWVAFFAIILAVYTGWAPFVKK